MMVKMNESKLLTIAQIEDFLAANSLIEFTKFGDDTERYADICNVLKRFDYRNRPRVEKSILRHYLGHIIIA
jgi:vacuolar-type H+-ATPase subunit C/Vma6